MLKQARFLRLWAIAALTFIVCAGFALDRGLFVGSQNYRLTAPCCAEGGVVQKRCRYLFVTGITEIDAANGRIDVDEALYSTKQVLVKAGFSSKEIADWSARQSAEDILKRRPDLDLGYCRLFGY